MRKLLLIALAITAFLMVSSLESFAQGDSLQACISTTGNYAGALRIVNSPADCKNNEAPIELLAPGEPAVPAECPCFDADDLAGLPWDECLDDSLYPHNIILTSPPPGQPPDVPGDVALLDTGTDGDKCHFAPSFGVGKTTAGLYDEEARECERLLRDRAETLGLECIDIQQP